MPVAPITGMLKKRFFTDLSISLGLGVLTGYIYWYSFHLPNVKRQEEYYLKLERMRQQENV